MAKDSESGNTPDLSPDEKSVARSNSGSLDDAPLKEIPESEKDIQEPGKSVPEKEESLASVPASGDSHHSETESDPDEYRHEDHYGYDMYYGNDEGRETDLANRNHSEHHASPSAHSENQWAETPHPALARSQSPPESDDEEEGGGPVKTFLEHLEDLRWVLIKVISAVIIGMVLCLVAGNRLIEVLKLPLERAKTVLSGDKHKAHFLFGTNHISTIAVNTNQLGSFHWGDELDLYVRLQPTVIGTTNVLGYEILTRDQLPTDIRDKQIQLKGYGPISPFMVALQIALYGGIGLASPFVIYFVGDFVLPALHRKEKSVLLKAVFFGAGMFLIGVVFCYTLLLHVALYASVNFAEWMNFTADEWRMEDYISFICKFMLAMGLSFELPVIILSLVKLDLISYQHLVKFRSYWIVANVALSSMLTPPDPMTMILMALPLQVLYEISVFVAWTWHRNDLKKQGAEAA